MKVALTIAGSDPCAGAGIQADLKTFHANGVYGLTAITAITVQNTQKVYSLHPIPPAIVYDQIVKLLDDIPIDAVKIGMLPNEEIVDAVSSALRHAKTDKIVLDPAMISKSGYALMESAVLDKIIELLFPIINTFTPNIDEASIFTRKKISTIADMKNSAEMIYQMGARNVSIKGGHLKIEHATDVLYDGRKFIILKDKWIDTKNSHGTGCTYASAMASFLANDNDFFDAARLAKSFVTQSLKSSFSLG